MAYSAFQILVVFLIALIAISKENVFNANKAFICRMANALVLLGKLTIMDSAISAIFPIVKHVFPITSVGLVCAPQPMSIKAVPVAVPKVSYKRMENVIVQETLPLMKIIVVATANVK